MPTSLSNGSRTPNLTLKTVSNSPSLVVVIQTGQRHSMPSQPSLTIDWRPVERRDFANEEKETPPLLSCLTNSTIGRLSYSSILMASNPKL